MRTPEQAFRAYYASMTDSDLLAVARNRGSFIVVAQSRLADELLKRQLAAPVAAPTDTSRAPSLFTKLRKMLQRETPGQSELSPLPPSVPEPAVPADSHKTHRPHGRITSIGATEDQVSTGTVPERINKHGDKVEDMAGTGQHDSLGG